MSEAGPLWPYSERDVTGVNEAAQTLLAEPEIRLSEPEKESLKGFAAELYAGQVNGEALPDLEEVSQMPVEATIQTYYADYFQTPDPEILKNVGMTEAPNMPDIADKVYGLIAQGETLDTKLWKTLASKSADWYKAKLGEQLLQPPEEDAAFEDCPTVQINFEPDALLDKFEMLQRYRGYYRQVRSALSEDEESELTVAKQVLLDMHIARVNNMTATLYPYVVQLAEQISQSPPTDRVAEWQRRLFAAAPVIRRLFHDGEHLPQTVTADDISRRLDLVRNGAESVGQPDLSPIANAARDLAAELDASREAGEQAAPTPEFPPEFLEKLANTTWEAPQMKRFCEAVLKDWELLSEHTTDWHEGGKRKGPADDRKWQVIVSPEHTSFSTDGPRKVLWVPESFKRTLSQASPAGALPVAAHELTHVLQNEYDGVLAQQLPLAKAKGRRYATGREMGGIYEERRVLAMLGKNRPTNTTYLHALEVKLAGGNQAQVARAFLQASIGEKQLTAAQLQTKAKSAGKSILRLYRRGGSDSQPLDYLEQELLLRSLDGLPVEQVRAITISGGSFSMKDAATLHQIDVLELPHTTTYTPAETVMRIYQEQFNES